MMEPTTFGFVASVNMVLAEAGAAELASVAQTSAVLDAELSPGSWAPVKVKTELNLELFSSCVCLANTSEKERRVN